MCFPFRKEYKGIFWQEEIVPFFQSLRLPAEATNAAQCYMEIAQQVGMHVIFKSPASHLDSN